MKYCLTSDTKDSLHTLNDHLIKLSKITKFGYAPIKTRRCAFKLPKLIIEIH